MVWGFADRQFAYPTGGDRLEIQNNKLQSTTALTPEQIHEMVFQEFNSQHFKKTFERLWELREIDKDLEEDDLESRLMEQPSLMKLGKLLRWLTTDDNKLV